MSQYHQKQQQQLQHVLHDSSDSLLYSEETLPCSPCQKACAQQGSERVWNALTAEPPTSPRVFTATASGVRLPETRREAGPAIAGPSSQNQTMTFLLSRVICLERFLATSMDVSEGLATELLLAHGGDVSKLSPIARKLLASHTRLQSEEAVIPGRSF